MSDAKLSVYDFGRRLLDSNDLDPVYVALWEASESGDLNPERLRRWLMAFWCFYHSGTASWATGSGDAEEGFWIRMRMAARSKDYPRCHERRHFRGDNAIRSVDFLESLGLDALFEPITRPCTYSLQEVTREVRTWVQFGPWIAFKVADMLERLDLCRIQFDVASSMYEGSPTEGAYLLARTEGVNPMSLDGGRSVTNWAVGRLVTELRFDLAPPRYERPINVQEVETILCKWKSYMGGHYELGEDVTGLRKALLRYARCPVSQILLKAGKRGGLWQ